MVARFEHVTRAVHVGYLKGWTRTVPPFHAHTYTRPLPCSTLHPGSLVSQLVSASHHRENRREFEVFNPRGIVDHIDIRRFETSKWADCPRWWSLWKLGWIEWRRWRHRRLFQRNLCAPPCNYPAGSALNDFAVRIKSRQQRARRVRVSYRRGVPRYRCLYLSPLPGLVTPGF